MVYRFRREKSPAQSSAKPVFIGLAGERMTLYFHDFGRSEPFFRKLDETLTACGNFELQR